ncbi:FAD-dependent oxidoreductase [Luteipulveratus halotolerans]|uniref:FAD-dependent oxidoreductase n=1 Tax=Luteipulveratus halotolerans TaxID=1631356 RepID=UPI0012FCC7EF|nr:hypothetical protein [Luteipulveratus halotolerans]
MRVAISGGSAVGATSALLFARSGWEVLLVEPETRRFVGDGGLPETAPRPGAPHAVHAHGLMSRARYELRHRLPDVYDDLLAHGGTEVTLDRLCPPALVDGGRDQDDDFTCLRSRRVLLDHTLGTAVRATREIVEIASRATGLEIDATGSVPRVTGVRVDGATERADLVIDAGGRRSPVSSWLARAGVEQPVQVDPGEVTYYSRHYRFERELRMNRGFADAHLFGSVHQFMFLGDSSTAMVALCTHDADPLLKRLRHPEACEAVLGANEDFAEWYAVLEPVSPVFALGSIDNRMRSLVRDGRPLVRGPAQVGDSLAMTNPTRGRGISMGLAAAGRLHDLAQEHTGDDLTHSYDAWQRDSLAPYYREASASDTTMTSALRASLHGTPVPPNAPDLELPHGHPVSADEVERAARLDPDLFRVVLRASMVLDDERRIASPEVVERVRRIGAPAAAPAPPPTRRLDDRAELVGLLADYA